MYHFQMPYNAPETFFEFDWVLPKELAMTGLEPAFTAAGFEPAIPRFKV